MNTAIIVCGSPGAGKSTWAGRLAAERHATLLDIDTVTERLVKLALAGTGHSPDDRDSDYFKQTFRIPIYDTLFDIARENLPRWLDEGVCQWVHFVRCDPELRRQRLQRRANVRDLAKLADWEKHVDYYGDEHPPVFDHVLVDGAGT